MPDIHITDATTLTQIQEAFEGAKGTKHLRGDVQGNRLYTHSSWKKSGLGKAAADRRAAKHEHGASFLKGAIDREYGPGVAGKVFLNLRLDHAKVSVGDLGRIAHEIEENPWKYSDMGTTLNDPDGFQAFYRFCQKEFCTENPDFWKAVEDWKAMPEGNPIDQQEKLDIAKGIVERFGKQSSPQQVNLGSDGFAALKKAADENDLEKLGTALKAAQEQIQQVMETDTFMRFLKAQG